MILSRNKLTDIWKESGITKDYEYGILTNEIYQEISGMKASEYKAYKNIRKESLRDNMTDIEVALTDLGEITTENLLPQKLQKKMYLELLLYLIMQFKMQMIYQVLISIIFAIMIMKKI